MTHARNLRTVGVLAVVGWLVGGLIAPGSSPAPVQSPPRSQPGWAPFVEPDFPFFSSVLDARKLGPGWPADNLTPRGLILNLGHDAWACFDTDLLRMSAMWIGNGVTPASMSQGSYHVAGEKAPEGQGKLPQIAGTPWVANGIYPGWQIGDAISFADPRDPGPDPQEVGRGPIDPALGRFNAVRMAAGGVRLEYVVAGASVLEWVDARLQNDRPVIQRRFQLTGVKRPLWLIVGRHPESPITLTVTGGLVDGNALAARVDQPDGVLAVRVSPSSAPVEFQATLSLGPLTVPSGAGNDSAAAPPASTRWPQTVVTRGVLSSAAGAYVVDRIALPLDNPWHRNVRLADIAFFGDGRAAAVTFDGDVWTISGLGGDLQDVRWKRFTSGLHEPLAIAVRGGELYVFDRNGIWRLRDTDGNGEADVHELFSNTFAQTAETREFASSMRAAPDGSFVIAKGGQEGTTVGRDNGSILRISPDGTEMTKLAYGLRQPFVSVHPKNGMITASDQQGNYIPSTPIHVITGTGSRYFGFIPLILPKEKYPAPIVEPLTWIPHSINASAASQVWLADARMGPLNDALIHLGYYRPEIFLVLLNRRAPRLQASVVSLTRELDFAPLAGAVGPADGQMYLTGFQIWGTEAKEISGLARLRYTGAPSTFPREIVPMNQGLLVRFDVALEARSATDPANYSAERWNYVRTANYGSPHYRVNGGQGQDTMTPSSAYLSRDGRSVFIGVPDMKPVMQMRLSWALRTRAGAAFEQSAYFTPYELTRFDPVREGFAPLTVNLTPRPGRASAITPVTVEEGKRLSALMGCAGCHSTDGSAIGKVGPSWKGLAGTPREFTDGTTATADDEYLRQSIRQPGAKIVRGFDTSDAGMPSYAGVLTDAQIDALILYIKSLR